MQAVLSAWPNIRTEQVKQRSTARIAPQAVVRREEPAPPRIWALIDEGALHRPVADADVMYEQCMHALEVSHQPHVSLAVVPYAARWHVGLLGACTSVERDGVPRAMYLDDLVTAGCRKARNSSGRAVCFRALQHAALSGGDSQDMIERLAKELWKG